MSVFSVSLKFNICASAYVLYVYVPMFTHLGLLARARVCAHGEISIECLPLLLSSFIYLFMFLRQGLFLKPELTSWAIVGHQTPGIL